MLSQLPCFLFLFLFLFLFFYIFYIKNYRLDLHLAILVTIANFLSLRMILAKWPLSRTDRIK